jgi:hypothetical protein
MTWNFNMDDAPRGTFEDVRRDNGKTVSMAVLHVPTMIIAAGNDGVVTVSKWLEKEGRWMMFTKGVPPLAWMPWPEHFDATGGAVPARGWGA